MPRAVAMMILCFWIAGCGPAAARTHPVAGSVSLDGKPLAAGEIYFVLPGKTPSILAIKDGQFQGETLAGVHRVEICAYRPRAGKAEMPGMTLPPENYLPAKYNAESKMTAEVTAVGPNQFTFAVASK